MAETASAPLRDVRVLDLASGPFGAIGRTLAELGADVVRVEPRQGAADRAQGLSVAGIGLSYVAASLGKRSVALDLDGAAGLATFEALAASADILIEAGQLSAGGAMALDVAGLRQRHPALGAGRPERFPGRQVVRGDAVAHGREVDPAQTGRVRPLHRFAVPQVSAGPKRAIDLDAQLTDVSVEIGRASCRERV